MPPSERKALIPRLLALYRDDPDAGIHGAAEWLLRRWKQADEIRRVDGPLATGKVEAARRWYVNRQGQAMVVVSGPVEFLMGSPLAEQERFPVEHLHSQRIDHSFAIAAKSVTLEEAFRFHKEYSVDRSKSPIDDCPVSATSWYMAAEYCNWLSYKEGLPKKEWCYEPNQEGEYEQGMKVPSDSLKRMGYRLPTEAEWEYACRAGATTSRYYGDSDELLGKYGWYSKNSAGKNWPVGSLKPNDLGLFDMHGNVWAWCHDAWSSDLGPAGNPTDDKADGSVVSDKIRRVLRGGGFGDTAEYLRSANRAGLQPGMRSNLMGIRPARTLPPGLLTSLPLRVESGSK